MEKVSYANRLKDSFAQEEAGKTYLIYVTNNRYDLLNNILYYTPFANSITETISMSSRSMHNCFTLFHRSGRRLSARLVDTCHK